MHWMALDKQIDITAEDTVFPSDNREYNTDLTSHRHLPELPVLWCEHICLCHFITRPEIHRGYIQSVMGFFFVCQGGIHKHHYVSIEDLSRENGLISTTFSVAAIHFKCGILFQKCTAQQNKLVYSVSWHIHLNCLRWWTNKERKKTEQRQMV